MIQTIEAVIDADGRVRLLGDWLRPEEDTAWSHLQRRIRAATNTEGGQ